MTIPPQHPPKPQPQTRRQYSESDKRLVLTYHLAMDLTTIVMPGAQSLVSTIVGEAWSHACSTMSRLWASSRSQNDRADETSSAEEYSRQFEAAREQSIALAGAGTEADRVARMELFWAGYLAGQIASRPELADRVSSLPALLGEPGQSPAAKTVHNTISGTVHGKSIQAGDINGNITF